MFVLCANFRGIVKPYFLNLTTKKKKNDELVLTFGSFFYFLKINRTIILDSDYSSTSRLYVSTRAFRKANGGLRNNSDFLEKYSNNPFLCFLFPKKAIREALHVV